MIYINTIRGENIVLRFIMILWTVQPEGVWKMIQSGKEFRCDGRKSTLLRLDGCRFPGGWNNSFRIPYTWMVQQMRLRGIQRDDRFPVWAWFKYHSADEGRKAPRIRNLAKYYEGQYRLKLSVPDELVLLSDFDEWHHPLMDMYCGSDRYVLKMMTMEDNKTWSTEKFRFFKRKSWEKVFNVNKSDAIQACFPSIKPEYVLDAVRISK